MAKIASANVPRSRKGQNKPNQAVLWLTTGTKSEDGLVELVRQFPYFEIRSMAGVGN
jgi:hypothetical protein